MIHANTFFSRSINRSLTIRALGKEALSLGKILFPSGVKYLTKEWKRSLSMALNLEFVLPWCALLGEWPKFRPGKCMQHHSRCQNISLWERSTADLSWHLLHTYTSSYLRKWWKMSHLAVWLFPVLGRFACKGNLLLYCILTQDTVNALQRYAFSSPLTPKPSRAQCLYNLRQFQMKNWGLKQPLKLLRVKPLYFQNSWISNLMKLKFDFNNVKES